MTYPQLMKYIIILDEKDNVGVALKDIPAGTYLLNRQGRQLQVVIREEIRAGHKIGVQHIKRNRMIYKYGYAIGVARADIRPGEHIHIHNMDSLTKNDTKGI